MQKLHKATLRSFFKVNLLKNNLFQIPFCVVILISSFSHATECEKLNKAEVQKIARAYMTKNKLIKPEDEQDLSALKMKIRWELVKTKKVGESCAVAMSVCTTFQNEKSCDDGPHEVLGLQVKSSKQMIVPFESILSVPKKLVAKIGSQNEKDMSFYYVELSGNHASTALKSAITEIPYGGFSGIAVRGAKASYDLSKGRDWKIVDGKYDFRRGLTAEVLDIQAYQFDGLDESGADGYWNECHKDLTKNGKTCQIAPWFQSYIREIVSLDGSTKDKVHLAMLNANLLKPKNIGGEKPGAPVFTPQASTAEIETNVASKPGKKKKKILQFAGYIYDNHIDQEQFPIEDHVFPFENGKYSFAKLSQELLSNESHWSNSFGIENTCDFKTIKDRIRNNGSIDQDGIKQAIYNSKILTANQNSLIQLLFNGLESGEIIEIHGYYWDHEQGEVENCDREQINIYLKNKNVLRLERSGTT